MVKWIAFVELSDGVWVVQTKATQATLGHVEWFSRWRKCVFVPLANTVYEQGCLRDIAAFCEAQTKERKKPKVTA